MAIKKLVILGKSDATITMILDNLDSINCFPEINIINNLGLETLKTFDNTKFDIKILAKFDEFDKINALILGGFQVNTKLKIFENFQIEKRYFINIFHHFSSISSTSKFGVGCLVNSMVSVAAHTKIGDFVSINRNSSIGHHSFISDFVTINPGCNIAGNVLIGKNTQIGMGTNIIDGINVGKNSIVGAGSLVTKNVPDNVMVYGSPAQIIKKI